MFPSLPHCTGEDELMFVCVAHPQNTGKVRGKVSSDNCCTGWQPARAGSKFQPWNVLCEFAMESWVLCQVSQDTDTVFPCFSFRSVPEMWLYILGV